MSALAIGGAYGISAAILIYAIESDLIEEELHAPLLMLWAVAGLITFVVGAMRRKSNS